MARQNVYVALGCRSKRMDEYPAAVLAIILWMAGCQQQLWHNVSIFLCVIKENICTF